VSGNKASLAPGKATHCATPFCGFNPVPEFENRVPGAPLGPSALNIPASMNPDPL
jgi:hypothetical protein